MDILFIIHILLTLTLLTIPFWPVDYLNYGVYIPLILSIIWLIFDGCPFSKLHKVDSSSFSQDLLRIFMPNVSDRMTEHLNTFILLSITILGFHKLNKIEIN